MATTTPHDKSQRVNPVRAAVLKSSQYTAVPNWVIDMGFRVAPYEASHLLLYLVRKTIGYSNSDGTLRLSLSEVELETKIGHDTISRWAHAFSYIGFIHYMPAGNGSRTSTFSMFPHGLPTKEQVHAAFSGIASAVKDETGHPRFGAKDFAARVRKHTIYWRLQCALPEAQREITARIYGDLKGLV